MLADSHGAVIHLGERDCSIQRRHQKLIEESPAPLVDAALRERIGKIATDAARAVGYRGAGTIEGLLQDGEYFFLEMNTRVQVEHCVTEATTGIDIVREQIRIAAGEPLSVDPGRGRRCAGTRSSAASTPRTRRGTSPPRPAPSTRYREPAGPGVRVDSGVLAGSEITPLYDPMVAKLIVWDSDREAATRRMARALEEFEIDGVRTLIPFHKAIMASEQWARAETCRDLVEDRAWLKTLAFRRLRRTAAARKGPSRWSGPTRWRCPASASTCACSASVGAAGGNGAAPAAAAPAARAPARRRRRARGRHAPLAAAGQRLQGAGRAGRDRRGGRAGLHHRGDEDGERDQRPQGGRDRRAADLRGRRGHPRRHARGDQDARVGGELRRSCEISVIWTLISTRERSTSGSRRSQTAIMGSSTCAQLRAIGASRTQIGRRHHEPAADPPSSRGVRGGTPAADEAGAWLAAVRALGSGRRAEPYPGGGALGHAPAAGRKDPRDGAGRRPREAQRHRRT